jgi:hypothetical protein
VFYTGTPGQQVTFNITLPYPFVTQGANPIHAYDWVTVTSGGAQQCLAPGNAFFVDSQQVKLRSYGTPPGASTTNSVTLTVPASGVVYLAVHLDYGFKGLSGFMKGLFDDAVDCATRTTVLVPNHGPYQFSVAGAQSGSTSIQNYNVFKRIPGVAGLVQYQTTGDPLPGTVVTLTNAKRVPVGSGVTDQDGFYMIPYKHTGKAATYYLSVATPPPGLYTETKAIKLKANAFVRLDFLVPTNSAGSATNGVGALTVASPPLLLTPRTTAGGTFTFTVSGPAGLSYVIEVSTDLQEWAPLASGASIATQQADFTDAAISKSGSRFYRVRLSD